MNAARRDRVRARLGDVDALLVTTPVNVRWLTGLVASSAAVLIRSVGEDVLATDGRYAEQAGEVAPELRVVTARSRAWVAEALGQGARLGVEADRITWAEVERLREALPGIEIVQANGLVEAERLRKDDDELARLARACAITADTMTAVTASLRPGLTEQQVARLMEQGFRERGADDRAFATIVASGPNAARPHHEPGARALAAGDLVVIDAGALVDGYHADMTRTVAIGQASGQAVAMYEAVQAAQRAGVAAVRVGVEAQAVDAAARAVLADTGFEDAIAHPTGHGVGLEIHEHPILRSGETATLPAGAVVTVEPGAYRTGFAGVRIEDTVAVTDAGCEVLTAAPTDLLTV